MLSIHIPALFLVEQNLQVIIQFFCWFATPKPDQKMMVKSTDDLTFLMSKHLYQQQP